MWSTMREKISWEDHSKTKEAPKAEDLSDLQKLNMGKEEGLISLGIERALIFRRNTLNRTNLNIQCHRKD